MLTLSVSTYFKRLLRLGSTGATLCLLFSQLAFTLKGLGLLIIFGYHRLIYQKYISLTHPNAIIHLHFIQKNEWRLTTRAGNEINACLLGNSWQSRHFIILHFQPKNIRKKIAVCIFSDALSKRDFKRLHWYFF